VSASQTDEMVINSPKCIDKVRHAHPGCQVSDHAECRVVYLIVHSVLGRRDSQIHPLKEIIVLYKRTDSKSSEKESGREVVRSTLCATGSAFKWRITSLFVSTVGRSFMMVSVCCEDGLIKSMNRDEGLSTGEMHKEEKETKGIPHLSRHMSHTC
jgi:hypothetical protein